LIRVSRGGPPAWAPWLRPQARAAAAAGRPARGFPVLTAVATAAAVAAAAAQYTIPAMIPALQRVPGGGLPDGQWWRLVTPLLVQTLGWYQVVANLVTLPVIGAVTERLLGRGWWLALAAAGTAGGEVAAYRWGEPGGGDSIAICGLAAGVIVTLLVRPGPGTRFAHQSVVYYVAALTGWGFYGLRAAAAACLLAGIGLAGLRRAGVPGADRIALVACVLSALALASLEQDLHGAALMAGFGVTAVVRAAARPVRLASQRRDVP
jgi:Rhomboid family